MKEFNHIDDVLEFAISEEQAAVDFYLMLAEQAKNPQTRGIFSEYAGEEMEHKAKLLRVRETGSFEMPDQDVKDLRITEYLVDMKPRPDMSYQDALILAMKKEKAAFRMYTALSERASDPAIKELFRKLALEESRHKLRFELEYDEYVLKEN